ncbi:uroporphyrinogen-III synthase [Bacillus salacetis]|uniref:uroporphyrinogen-III synthase n=1 Tax=Bacillus salacetis TaxID=2315464 RepID=UPI003BA34853
MNPSLPLAGREILVTREKKAAKGMADIIRQYGGIPRIVPLISFKPFQDKNERTYLDKLKSYEWIFFTSKNGVHFFFQKLAELNISLDGSGIKFAAVGEKTQRALEVRGIQVDFVPLYYTGLDFAKEFLDQFPDAGHVLLSKGNLARDTISSYFLERNKLIDEWITYETTFPADSADRLIASLKERALSALTFTSPSTIRRFMKVVNDHHLHDFLSGLAIVCIGPVTKEAAESCGLAVQVAPERYTVEEMIQGLAQYYNSFERE